MAQSNSRKEEQYNRNDDHSDERDKKKKSIIFMSVMDISWCIRKEINEYRQSFENKRKKICFLFLIYYFYNMRYPDGIK